MNPAVKRACRVLPALALALTAQIALPAAAAAAANWRLRARENFESGRIDLGDGRGSKAYRGFLSAFDVFYEEPFERSYGLTVHRGSVGRVGPKESVTVTALGVEAKIFPTKKARLWFARGGLLAQAFDPSGAAKAAWTYGLSAGTGAEFPVWKLGLAPEVGGKFLWGSQGRHASLFHVALGVHFYVFPGDSSPRAR